jgi:hypothetical protein
MKKISFIIAAALLSIPALSFAGAGAASGTDYVSAAGAAITGTKTGGSNQPMGQLSSNVILDCKFSTSTFSATTKHLNGSKEYGSSSGSTKIYSKELAPGTAAPSTPGASDATAFDAWTAM